MVVCFLFDFIGFFSFLLLCQVHELLGLWREEFPRGMPPEEYARKRNQLSNSEARQGTARRRARARSVQGVGGGVLVCCSP